MTDARPVEPHLTPSDLSLLARGEVIIRSEPVSGQPIPRVTVIAVIEAPPARVWPLIDNVGDYQRTMAGVKSSRELSRQGEVVRVQATIGLPFPLKDLTATSESIHRDLGGGRYLRQWQMIEGDYRENRGSWTLSPFDGDARRTLLVYQVMAVPRIPLPQKIQELAQKKAAPRMVEQLRKLAR